MFKTAPKPLSLLGYHRILSPTAGVRVSPLCLGMCSIDDHLLPKLTAASTRCNELWRKLEICDGRVYERDTVLNVGFLLGERRQLH
jgi:hypothetical protein